MQTARCLCHFFTTTSHHLSECSLTTSALRFTILLRSYFPQHKCPDAELLAETRTRMTCTLQILPSVLMKCLVKPQMPALVPPFFSTHLFFLHHKQKNSFNRFSDFTLQDLLAQSEVCFDSNLVLTNSKDAKPQL